MTTTLPPTRLVTLSRAAKMLRLTRNDLVVMVGERDRHIRDLDRPEPWDIVAPVSRTRTGMTWDWDALRLWGLKMGYATWNGRRVIGYLGLAVLLDLTEQAVRARTAVRNTHIAVNGRPDPEDIPAPAVVLKVRGAVGVALFDYAHAIRWAVHTERLAPDEVTPTRLKPNTRTPRPG